MSCTLSIRNISAHDKAEVSPVHNKHSAFWVVEKFEREEDPHKRIIHRACKMKRGIKCVECKQVVLQHFEVDNITYVSCARMKRARYC